MNERIRCKGLESKIMTADQAASLILDGMVVGTSGFTPCGYPKVVPEALAQQAEAGRKVGITLLTGASVGPELDGRLTEAGVMKKRAPYQTNPVLQKALNDGRIEYIDQHLSHSAQQYRNKYYGKVNVAIIEVCAITEEGHLVPTTSMGNSPSFVDEADIIIVEVNTAQPAKLEGMHDVYVPLDPPNRLAIPIINTDDRIGTPYIVCGPDKITAIVMSDVTDKVRPLAPLDDESKKMASNLIEFLKGEVEKGCLPNSLLPLQSGVGNVANAVLAGLADSDFEGLEFYSEVIQDAALDMIDCGKFVAVSGTSMTPSETGLKRFIDNIDFYREKIILRPQEISNNPEVARRLGVISMNTAIEVDIYGNVNSTHVMGTRMMNGIGGSGDFTRNASISIFLTGSTAKNGDISAIVPMVSHHDHTEHDVMVIVSEQGVADLRGLSPRERAQVIIDKCAHPDYKPMLQDYFDRAKEATVSKGIGHTPHILGEALSWHERFVKTGSMKIK